MAANSVLTHRNVGVLSIDAVEAPEIVTSAWIDEQLAETYERTGMKAGILADLAGIEARRWWPEGVTFEKAAALAGRAALDAVGHRPGRCRHADLHVGVQAPPRTVGGLFRPRPARSRTQLSQLRRRQRLPRLHQRHADRRCGDRFRFDRLRTRRRRRGKPLHPGQTTIERLQRPDRSVNDIFAEFASLTLGSGAAAASLCRLDRHPESHRLVGGIARSATQHNELCIGDLDRMHTDTHGLLIAGLDLAEAAWKNSGHDFDWEVGMDHYIVHQVSQCHTDCCVSASVSTRTVPADLPAYGNVGPAAIPITLAAVQNEIQAGRACAVHGHRFGPQHELHRNRLVTTAPDQPDGATWRGWGIDPAWSRLLDVGSHDGDTHRWHLLDTGPGDHRIGHHRVRPRQPDLGVRVEVVPDAIR